LFLISFHNGERSNIKLNKLPHLLLMLVVVLVVLLLPPLLGCVMLAFLLFSFFE